MLVFARYYLFYIIVQYPFADLSDKPQFTVLQSHKKVQDIAIYLNISPVFGIKIKSFNCFAVVITYSNTSKYGLSIFST